MKLQIRDQGSVVGEQEMPKQFSEAVRPDLIKRAVLALESHQRQPYGAKSDAGMRASAKLSRRRHNYRGAYGHGISRVPRKILSRSGTRFNWVGAVAPGTVGGRRAHPPKAEKIWDQKINIKERRKAIRGALAATVAKEVVAERGHLLPEGYPFVISGKIEGLSTAKAVQGALIGFGLQAELDRMSVKVRAGKGKMRGRKYRKTRGPLLVVSGNCALKKAAKNLKGVEVVEVNKLNASLLAPGANPGRLTLYTDKSLSLMSKEGLFA